MRVLLALTLAGCAIPSGRTYTVRYDDSLPADARADVAHAVGAWQAAGLTAIPPVVIPLSVDADAYGVILVTARALPDGLLGETWPEHGLVALDLGQIAADGAVLQWIATHELGHAMGLPHMTGHTVMAALYPDQAPGPTPEDVAALGSR